MYYNKRLHPRHPGVHGVHYQDCAVEQYNRLVEFFEQSCCDNGSALKGCKLSTVLCTCKPDNSNGLVDFALFCYLRLIRKNK